MAAETLNFRKVPKVIGIKQSIKAVEKSMAATVYIADDADIRMIAPLQQICCIHEISIVTGYSMEELGMACGIDVGAAAVTLTE
jgi:large subunit ribosomal protein L7A